MTQFREIRGQVISESTWDVKVALPGFDICQLQSSQQGVEYVCQSPEVPSAVAAKPGALTTIEQIRNCFGELPNTMVNDMGKNGVFASLTLPDEKTGVSIMTTPTLRLDRKKFEAIQAWRYSLSVSPLK